MQRSNGIDGDRVLVWCGVFVAHLLAVWCLTRPHEREAVAETEGLDVVWIEPGLAVVPAPDRKRNTPRVVPPDAATISGRDAAPQRVTAPVAVTPSAEVEDSASLSAVFLEQGRAWVKTRTPRDDFVRNPLTRRTLPRTDARADRFVMQKEIAPADVVAGIGALFGGGGDLVDCARIRDSIADLATGGASERLEEELRRKRRLCR